MNNMNVAVVLVTFNRLKSLKKALEKYERQTRKPKYILVVDNASQDGTAEFLQEWKNENIKGISKNVVFSHKNLGGSGGFALGIKEASSFDCEFLFLADDDAMAEPDMLEKLNKGYVTLLNAGKTNISAFCTAIYNFDKHEYLHRCKVKKGLFGIKFFGIPEKYYNRQFFQVDILTFVGACISKSAIKVIGNVKTDYFIYYDDSDYSMRLNQVGDIYCIPASVMHHDIGNNRIASWKAYYDTRNWINLVKNYFSKYELFCTIFKTYIKRCSIVAKIARDRSKKFRKMCLKAIKDGLNDNLGINNEYKPGKEVE